MASALSEWVNEMAAGRSSALIGNQRQLTDDLLDRLYSERGHNQTSHRAKFQWRANLQTGDDKAAYAGMITTPNQASGPYQGTSLVWFPATKGSLLVLVIGTEGFGADQELLGRPGHARRLRALGRLHGNRIWVKPDLLDLSFRIADAQWEHWGLELEAARRTYEPYIYAAVPIRGNGDQGIAEDLLDFFLTEHRTPLTGKQRERWDRRLLELRRQIFEPINEKAVQTALKDRRFVVLEGPPGTGKTRLARQLAGENSTTIQFHPARTYEDFGSARHVPPWLLAAPVLSRIESLLARYQRAFIEVVEERETPRGRVDWGQYVRRSFVAGRWTRFDCTYPEPALDPILAANIRWTTERLRVELNQGTDLELARSLIERIDAVEKAVDDGPRLRPEQHHGREASTVFEALEAMGWVADERGLGGARVLDGLAWDVSITAVWEEWVRRFVTDLAPRLGMRTGGPTSTAVALTWRGAAGSMQKLKPDAAMLGPRRTVWFDAKYKPHLAELQRRGWFGASNALQSEHRADLHQALAYAACGSTDVIDAVLVYPSLSSEPRALGLSHAEVGRGARRSRIILGALPFGFSGPDQREQALNDWQMALRES